jgi:hypothetical protein
MSIKAVRWTLRKSLLCLAAVGVVLIALVYWLTLARQRLAYAETQRCISNLIHIRIAKIYYKQDFGLEDGDSIPEKALDKYLIQSMGKTLAACRCPSGGTYIIGAVGTNPRCTYTNVCYTYHFSIDKHRLERGTLMHSLYKGVSH